MRTTPSPRLRLDGAWIILDNRWLRLVEDTAMLQAVPLFALGSEGVRQFLPDVLIGERRARRRLPRSRDNCHFDSAS